MAPVGIHFQKTSKILFVLNEVLLESLESIFYIEKPVTPPTQNFCHYSYKISASFTRLLQRFIDRLFPNAKDMVMNNYECNFSRKI